MGLFLTKFYMETRSENLCHYQRVYKEMTEFIFISPKIAFPSPFIFDHPRAHTELNLPLLFRSPVLPESLFAILSMISTLSVMFSMTHMGPQLSSP